MKTKKRTNWIKRIALVLLTTIILINVPAATTYAAEKKEVIEEIMSNTDQIVDTGGGVVLDNKNMQCLKNGGFVFCLWSDIDVLHDRTKDEAHRPLLNVEDPIEKIKELLEYRRPFYEKAEFQIDTTDFNVDNIISQIKRMIDG